MPTQEQIDNLFEDRYENFDKFPERKNGRIIKNDNYKKFYLITVEDIIKKLDLRYSEGRSLSCIYEEYEYIKVYYYTLTKGNYYNFYWKIFVNHDSLILKGVIKDIYVHGSNFTYLTEQWEENKEEIKKELKEELEDDEERLKKWNEEDSD